MARQAIVVDGLDELRVALRRLQSSEIDAEMKALHKDLGDEVVSRARPNVPVRTGALRASLRASGTKRDAIGRAGKKSVPYAPIVHWKHGPPFLRDAAETIERDIVDRYQKAIDDVLDRVIGRI